MLAGDKKQGFTLIELLVVIAIIGLLATLSVLALNSARAKSRDTTRLANLRQIANAISMYEQDNGVVPSVVASCLGLIDGQSCWIGVNGNTALNNMLTPYLKVIPKDPSNNKVVGGYYVYVNKIPTWHCTGTIFPFPKGAYILWLPESKDGAAGFNDSACLNMGFMTCCDVGNCSNGFYCAYPATI